MTELKVNEVYENNFNIIKKIFNSTFFLTGGTGFFGKSFLDFVNYSNLIHNANIKVHILTRNSDVFIKSYPEYSTRNIHFYTGDIKSFSFPNFEIDYILNFATPASASFNREQPMEMLSVIYEGQKRVCEMAAKLKCKSVLFTSSGAVYGKQPQNISHISESYEGAPSTQSIIASYGEGKRVAELIGNIYSETFGFEHKIARCFAFAGRHLPANTHFAIGNFIMDAVKGRTININGDGTPLRSYLYSDDLIIWLLTILLEGKNKTPYNVGSDHAISIKNLAEKIIELINPNVQLSIATSPVKGAPVAKYIPSIELCKKELNLKVFTSLDNSILNMAAEYRMLS